MFRKKILLIHPTGNANVRAVLEGLHSEKYLDRFYTTIAVSEDSFWIKILTAFKKRSYNPSLLKLTVVHPFRELMRLVSQRIGFYSFITHETGFFSIDKVNRGLDAFVASKIKKNSIIYAYEDAALTTFKKAKDSGGFCIYDLPIGYWRAMRYLLEEERVRRSAWAKTLTGFKDSESKVARKDEELMLADLIIVASTFTLKTLERFPGKLPPVKVIPYGFPPVYENRDYTHLIKSDTLKLLFVGGLSQRKGIANVFEAVEQVDNVSLTVIGRKPVTNCEPLNRFLLKHRYIESLNHDAILNEMRAHDVLLFPSLFEGYGLVITEAMSQGTPVITTDRTCGADFIEDGINGWLVEPGNTQALVHKINHILSDIRMIEKIGIRAQELAAKNPISQYGSRLLATLRQEIFEY
ncbi:glycosyl transferase family 1 [Christiangramia fulva]|uniref:Glycosyl transferase family 1 n=1 Tax=Christiangramia fulva TaxID=2126553 RepID=A0A2R3Z4S2_9FLAO|nr:glycosyltransferase family 4 protein [Christiangramia fulva]AVR45277.1 glycosyl transferase family 1 [Christiangramia fulva]